MPSMTSSMLRRFWPVLGVAVGVTAFTLVGCNGPATPATGDNTTEDHDHDHDGHDHDHDHGEAGHAGHEHDHGDHAHGEMTYGQAVAKLEALRADIETGFAEGDYAKADGPVHQVGHVLEDISALAKKASLPAAAQAEIETAVSTLFDNFGAVDETIHNNGEGKKYADVAEPIQAAMATLKKHVPAGQP